MDFIHFETAEKNQDLNFSDEEQTNDKMDFIDDPVQMSEGESFYRNADLSNKDNYNKFPNQARDPRSAVSEDHKMFFGVEDTQTELYQPENRGTVKLDFLMALKSLLSPLKKCPKTLRVKTPSLIL